MGGAFIAFGLFISSLTKNQIVAGVLTFCTLLMLLLVGWLRDFVGPVGHGDRRRRCRSSSTSRISRRACSTPSTSSIT